MSPRFRALRSVVQIPLRSRNDPRSPEKSLFAAQPYFFDHSSDCAIFNLELGLQPLRLPRRGCRKNIHSHSELLFRIPGYLNFAHEQWRSSRQCPETLVICHLTFLLLPPTSDLSPPLRLQHRMTPALQHCIFFAQSSFFQFFRDLPQIN